MAFRSLVTPLDDEWQSILDRELTLRRWPKTSEHARLGALVQRLSAAYNDPSPSAVSAGGPELLAARLGFSFARDVPKGAAAVRELVGTGTLALPAGRPLRVLDIGAGIGATTWGLVRALAAAGQEGEVHATFLDQDRQALELADAIARARSAERGVTLKVETAGGALSYMDGIKRLGVFDVVLLGQVLSESLRDQAEDVRQEKHAVLLSTLLERSVAPDGSLVVIEPALRERTRHLHALRDRLLAARPGSVFAPCLHQGACPARRLETDWCHEDLPVDLPPWLVPVARAAGLRYQGLTFSYLALRRDGKTLRSLLTHPGGHVRVVSDRIVTKGKREAFVCGDVSDDGNVRGDRVRAMRLDRHRAEGNAAWDGIVRGDIVTTAPPLDAARPRILEDTPLVVES